jgi:hypothetical protein
MPKKPVKTDTPKTEEESTKKADDPSVATKAKQGHTFLKVDKSHRPAGFHCDELNTSYNQYDQN